MITTAWAFAVLLGIFASNACGSPGAHINPAVTLAMALMGNTPWDQVPVFVSAQFIGGFIGAILVYLHYMPHFKATEDGGTKLGVFSTGPAIRDWTNWLGEIFGTFMLVFSIVGIGKLGNLSDGFGPYLVAMVIWSLGLSLGGTTGYALNPARDLAPRIAHFLLPIPAKGDSDWSYAPIPAIGPLIGGGLAALFVLASGI
ncbi:MAG: aquaporin family protein [Methylobacteriaceae bacterium]|nr:aquaporin family protein [Methylobacteriaceae bacterium]